jgi:nuclear cap-binding protein subunit 2
MQTASREYWANLGKKREAEEQWYRGHVYLRKNGAQALQRELLASTLVHVSGLSKFTGENQLHALFSRCGHVLRVIMGLDRQRKTPCGFCFAEYADHESAVRAVAFLHETRVDDRPIAVRLDCCYEEERRWLGAPIVPAVSPLAAHQQQPRRLLPTPDQLTLKRDRSQDVSNQDSGSESAKRQRI